MLFVPGFNDTSRAFCVPYIMTLMVAPKRAHSKRKYVKCDSRYSGYLNFVLKVRS